MEGVLEVEGDDQEPAAPTQQVWRYRRDSPGGLGWRRGGSAGRARRAPAETGRELRRLAKSGARQVKTGSRLPFTRWRFRGTGEVSTFPSRHQTVGSKTRELGEHRINQFGRV